MNKPFGQPGLTPRFSAEHDLAWLVCAEDSSTAVSSFGGFHLEGAHRSADRVSSIQVTSGQIYPVCVGWRGGGFMTGTCAPSATLEEGPDHRVGNTSWSENTSRAAVPAMLAVRGSLTNRLGSLSGSWRFPAVNRLCECSTCKQREVREPALRSSVPRYESRIPGESFLQTLG